MSDFEEGRRRPASLEARVAYVILGLLTGGNGIVAWNHNSSIGDNIRAVTHLQDQYDALDMRVAKIELSPDPVLTMRVATLETITQREREEDAKRDKIESDLTATVQDLTNSVRSLHDDLVRQKNEGSDFGPRGELPDITMGGKG